ncbi:MAG: LytTR family DNA-binding domain-containing protein [Sphingomonadaceae bacterium]
MPLRTLIVDDEPLAVERLQILCARLPDLQLVGTANDGEAALRLVEALEPDLLFLDIAMPGMTGMEVARALAGRANRPAIVFVTAFDSFAVAAFDAEAVDYLMKPVASERLARAVERVRARREERSEAAQPPADSWCREFWVPSRGELVRVEASAIDWIEAERDYMRLHIGERSFLIHETISALEERLDPAQFLRVHRSAILRRDAIARLTHDGQGNWAAELGNGTVVRIGRTYLAAAKGAILEGSQGGAA